MVIAMVDPNPLVNNGGISALRAAGIYVDIMHGDFPLLVCLGIARNDVATRAGAEAEAARRINEDFVLRITSPVSAPSAAPPPAQPWGGEWAEEVAVAADLAQRALAICKHVQGALSGTGPEELSRLKGDMTPVTAADLAVQALVSLALQQRFPGDVLVAEEDAALLRPALPAPDSVTDAAAARALMRAVCGLLRQHGGPYLPADGGDGDVLATAVVEAVGRRGEGGGRGGGRGWVLDPVDGTAGLRTGRGYVTGLCLVDAGGAAVAAMGNGAADERACVMLAVRGGGVRYWPLRGPPTPSAQMVLTQVPCPRSLGAPS